MCNLGGRRDRPRDADLGGKDGWTGLRFPPEVDLAFGLVPARRQGAAGRWYLYSPLRIKYPLIRSALIDAYRKKKRETGDPMKAWKALQEDEEARRAYQKARGMGGFRRASWDEVMEIMAVANIHTAEKYGPDRVIGFSPIPAMSMLSYAAGGRFLQLFGGVNLSFYDWYCDLPTAFPEIWGEQTDVCESADWYNAKMIADMGACLNMTRTPDCHFFAESRHNGTKAVVFSPDFSQVCKYADQWVPLHAGSDGAFWMATTHVILKEFHHEKQTPYFIDYVKKYTDSPYLVKLEKDGDSYKPGRLLRASEIPAYRDISNGEWKFLNIDANTGELVVPKGSSGSRWDEKQGNWNIKPESVVDDQPYDPVLTLLGRTDEVVQTTFVEYGLDRTADRGVPVMRVETTDGPVLVTTVYDLTMGQFGVGRGLPGDYPESYDDKDAAYTPAWQELFTGVASDTVLQFAREWANTADTTGGKAWASGADAILHIAADRVEPLLSALAADAAKLAETLVAFANSRGGTVYVGAEARSGRALGLADPGAALERALAAAHATDPPLIIPLPRLAELVVQVLEPHRAVVAQYRAFLIYD